MALVVTLEGFPLAILAILSFIAVWMVGPLVLIVTPWLLWASFSQLAALGGLSRGDPKAARRVLRSATSRIVVLGVLLIAIVSNGGWHRTGVWVAAFLTSALIVLACALRLDTVRRTVEHPQGPWPELLTGAGIGLSVTLLSTAIGFSIGLW